MSCKLEAALVDLKRQISAHYGPRLRAIYRVDRNQALEDFDRSDAELVILLADDNWRMFEEKDVSGSWTFDAVLEHGVYVRAWPIPAAAWNDPDTAEYPSLVRELRAHAQQMAVPA